MHTELITALDVPTQKEAIELASLLQSASPWMKVGLELFCSTGPEIVKELKKIGCMVFLDLKFHDIPNTVASAISTALSSGADICDIHLSGGESMARAAAAVIQRARINGSKCKLFGVTVLTSTSQEELGCDPTQKVLEYAKIAHAARLDGVVCSALEASAVKAQCGNELLCLCPGIRPKGGRLDDQSRVMSPDEAARSGADYIVVGRPITRADNPLEAARQIIKTLQEA